MGTPDFAVVCWKWKPHDGYRSKFGPETVNTLRRMVDRHFHRPHRFICVTDDAEGIDPEVEIVPLWKDFGDLQNPHGPIGPSCYRRLRMFSPEAAQWFGPRFVSLDLDVVLVNDVGPLWLRNEDFVIYGDTNPTTPYNGSMVLMTAGCRPKVWTDFDPIESPKATLAKGYYGSDQAWIGLALGPNEKKWSHRDGVFSFRNEIGPYRQDLPAHARVIIFHGHVDPWSPRGMSIPWVAKNYR